MRSIALVLGIVGLVLGVINLFWNVNWATGIAEIVLGAGLALLVWSERKAGSGSG